MVATLKITTLGFDDCTIGRVNVGGNDFHAFSLELPWKDNITSVSCIPAGTYDTTFYDSPAHGKVLLLQDVPGRTYVEIHSGNYTDQTEGCILLGDSIKYLNSDGIPDVTNSRYTLNSLFEFVGATPPRVRIVRHGNGE